VVCPATATCKLSVIPTVDDRSKIHVPFLRHLIALIMSVGMYF